MTANKNQTTSAARKPGWSSAWMYIWLFFAPLITVPWMLIGVSAIPFIHSDQQAWSPDGRRIAFWSRHGDDFAIYVMNADGSQQTRLAGNDAYDGNPTWSPDGRRIAFLSFRDGNSEIYVMNADGSQQTRLTNNQDYDRNPTWSTDGRRIAFHSGRDWHSEIYVMNADGSQQTRLTNNQAADEYPIWSPDGRHIAFHSDRDGNSEIYVMNADGSQQTRLTNNRAADKYPIWSPDGRHIAFCSHRDGNYEIYVMNTDGSQQTRLTNNQATDEYPTWSPDGRRIAFLSFRDGNSEIYVMNADGSQQTRLTNNQSYDGDPTWSPDGSQLLFVSDHSIYLINANGTALRELTEVRALVPVLQAVLFPAIVHVVLFAGLLSSSLCVRRHTQQAVVLAGLRTLSAVTLMGLTRGEGWTPWFLANGSLWLFGSLLGVRQVRSGDCWLMRLRGERALLPRFAAVPAPVPVPPEVAAPTPTIAPVAAAPAPTFSVPTDPQAAFEMGQSLVAQGRREQAIECFMFVFRNGSPELRERAVQELEKLGEVERG